MARVRRRPLQPTLVFRPDPLGLGQEAAHIVPDGGVQHISADLFVPAQSLAAEAIGVGTGAAVVGVRDLTLGRRQTSPSDDRSWPTHVKILRTTRASSAMTWYRA